MEGCTMKTIWRILGVLLALSGGQAVAQELAGTWQGKLAIDKTTSMTIRFTFAKQATGKYTALLSSPDNAAVKDVPATAVSFSAGALKVDVASLSGAYNGSYKDGRFEGQWTQQGSTLPLVLSPYELPQLSRADAETLTGTWSGKPAPPASALTFVYKFSQDGKGGLRGSLSVPEQGGAELPMSDIVFANNKLTFKVPAVQGEYTATHANGVLTGHWTQAAMPLPPPGLPVSLKKGDYVATVHALKLSPEAFADLNGVWRGKLGPLTLSMRFEVTPNGQAIVGFIDSPDQQAMGIPITEATYEAGKLAMKVGSVMAEYTGKRSGKTIAGTWKQAGMENPLTLTKQ
jgi:hypothetical protein